MLANYLKTAVRGFQRQRLYAVLNVAGLALGIASCTLIGLFVRDELTFDRFHAGGPDLYRVYLSLRSEDGSTSRMAVTPMPLGPALGEDVPGVARVSRYWQWSEVVRRGDRMFEEQLTFVDPAFLEMFTFPLREGDAARALRDRSSVVVTAATARKYFGDGPALGRQLSIQLGEQSHDFTVAGVAEDVPGGSSLRFALLLPYDRVRDLFSDRFVSQWGAFRTSTYVQLGGPAARAAVEAKLPGVVRSRMGEIVASWFGGDESALQLHLQPLADVHLDPSIEGLEPASSPRASYLLSAMALVILLLACLNFTLLSVGRATQRAREVGVRKVVGAQRAQLVRQFLGESLLTSLLALGLGLGLAELVLPTFNALAEKTLRLDLAGNAGTLGAVLALTVATGLAAGAYPALYLSRFRPAEVLKGSVRGGGRHWFGRSLVTLQFAAALFLAIGTLVMARQLAFVQEKSLGLAGDQVVVVPTQQRDGAALLETFRNQLAGRPEVTRLAGAFEVPGDERGFSKTTASTPGGADGEVFTFRIDPDYLETVGLRLVAGRPLSDDLSTDAGGAVLVNEALVRHFGWREPLGQTLRVGVEGLEEVTVAGVVADYHFQSLHHPIAPAVLHTRSSWPLSHLFVRIRPGAAPAALALLEKTWRAMAPDLPFTYTFLDDAFAAQYASEQRWSRIVALAAGLALLIAALGLFGVATLAAAQRTKEIGIRKVMGATVPQVALLVARDFVRFALLAFAVAAPVAYVVMSRWLEGFAYRAELPWTLFAAAGAGALSVALLSVGYQSVRAARADPVASLRYE